MLMSLHIRQLTIEGIDLLIECAEHGANLAPFLGERFETEEEVRRALLAQVLVSGALIHELTENAGAAGRVVESLGILKQTVLSQPLEMFYPEGPPGS
jgi:hypothetical protein